MEITDYFSDNIKNIILAETKNYRNNSNKNQINGSYLNRSPNITYNLNEIRFRVNNPIILKIGQEEKVLNYIVSSEEISKILQRICDCSIYAYQSQISEGFITINGGHRVGISGNVAIKEGKVITISQVYSLNFRIANQIFGCCNEILTKIIDENKKIHNTLIVSAPGCGKTTILKDLALNISNGVEKLHIKGMDVSIIDERGEIAGMHNGIPQNNVGIRTDVINNVPKTIGIKMAIRSLTPKVIIADEIGNKSDAEVINYAVCSGVVGIFTAHGDSLQDLKNNQEINKLIELNIFKNIIFLDKDNKGKIREIWRSS